MSALAVDASVWVAAQDPTDPFCTASRAFLTHALVHRITLHVPAIARVEVACALARRLRDSAEGLRLANLLLSTAGAKEHPMSAALLANALSTGTTGFLRGADAIYAATAEMLGCQLVSWDKEHVRRAGAVLPDRWLTTNS
ncbi:MAG: PIN domain-containing protein [Verrucomicrobia bacterium]|nr:PIN domain-containing protein [Verrucomicrobiota bacterium]